MNDKQPLLNPMQPPMMYTTNAPQQVNIQPQPMNIQPQPMQIPQNNLGGGVQVTANLPPEANPIQQGGNVHTFGSNINMRAWIFFIVGMVLCIIGPLSMGITIIVGGVLICLSVFLMKKTRIDFDDNNRTIGIYTSGAIIGSIGERQQSARYEEVNDFMVKIISGMLINNQPAAKVVMSLKDGSSIDVSSAEMLYPAQAYAQRLKNFLGQRVR